MATLEDRVAVLERALGPLQELSGAIQGKPASALISIPHNDSWLFEDNVDGTHPANLRYVISANVQRVVSARLSIHLASYRTYSNFSVTATSAGSAHNHNHNHTSASHAHTIPLSAGPFSNAAGWDGGNLIGSVAGTAPTNSTSPAGTGSDATNEASHTHSVSGSSFLGITEGAIATSVTLSFDGADHTSELQGPFSTDVIELDVLRFLPLSKGVLHVLAMQPSGLGRIEAHLRLGVYVSAGSVF